LRAAAAARKAATRIELRCPDPMANPYLALALMLVSGLDGIEKKIELVPEVKENIYHMSEATRAEYGIEALPADLNEALEALAKDEVLKAALGETLYTAYVNLKKEEWDEYRLEVHAWELKKYN
jgi:glutamine synthetase